MTKYRDAAQKLALAGYDLAEPDHAITDISQRLEVIDTARKNEKELVAEYSSLLQVLRYVKLTDEPRFVKNPKWEKFLPQKNGKIPENITIREQDIEF